MLHPGYKIRVFSSSQIVKFPWLTPRYNHMFFWSKLSAIFTKNVRKHCLHACSFLRVCFACLSFQSLPYASLFHAWSNEPVNCTYFTSLTPGAFCTEERVKIMQLNIKVRRLWMLFQILAITIPFKMGAYMYLSIYLFIFVRRGRMSSV